ncbi:hypothetical protein OSB04_029652 [Centaurea solstitialis]|uniref:Uncharacterized protein n=1 Tax=Centaurea solstitialis TaxID=347529 RepID=A0AA38S796_9ASTR|nr:hypothetical protein OSB04_029652 [Centaurea solstitialis]
MAATIAFLRVLWTNYYDQASIGGHGPIVLVRLLTLLFLLVYGLANGIEHIVSVAFPDPISIYGVIARLGKMVFICAFINQKMVMSIHSSRDRLCCNFRSQLQLSGERWFSSSLNEQRVPICKDCTQSALHKIMISEVKKLNLPSKHLSGNNLVNNPLPGRVTTLIQTFTRSRAG